MKKSKRHIFLIPKPRLKEHPSLQHAFLVAGTAGGNHDGFLSFFLEVASFTAHICWSKQVTWPSPTSVGEGIFFLFTSGIASHMAVGGDVDYSYGREVNIWKK